MTRLSDLQSILLSTASQRENGQILPWPESVDPRGGAKAVAALLRRGFVEERAADRPDGEANIHITTAGLQAIGIEAEVGQKEEVIGTADPGAAAPSRPTKAGMLLALIGRPEGAVMADLIEATGWLPHTVRAALTGGPGPYMYLPIVGPTTLRDIIGDTVDNMAVPFLIGKPFTEPAYVIPATILNQLGERAAFDDTVRQIRKEDDPYAAYRELYLKQRKTEIEALHGRTGDDAVPVYGRRMGEGEGARQ